MHDLPLSISKVTQGVAYYLTGTGSYRRKVSLIVSKFVLRGLLILRTKSNIRSKLITPSKKQADSLNCDTSYSLGFLERAHPRKHCVCAPFSASSIYFQHPGLQLIVLSKRERSCKPGTYWTIHQPPKSVQTNTSKIPSRSPAFSVVKRALKCAGQGSAIAQMSLIGFDSSFRQRRSTHLRRTVAASTLTATVRAGQGCDTVYRCLHAVIY
jgi:hypothetical protein